MFSISGVSSHIGLSVHGVLFVVISVFSECIIGLGVMFLLLMFSVFLVLVFLMKYVLSIFVDVLIALSVVFLVRDVLSIVLLVFLVFCS